MTLKSQTVNKQRAKLVERALLGKREDHLIEKCFKALLSNYHETIRQRYILRTVIEFRNHGLVHRGFNNMKLHSMKRRKSRLLNVVAYEFRAERVQYTVYDDTPYKTFGGSSGRHLTKDKALQLKCFVAWAKYALTDDHLETRLEQVLRSKGQIMQVRCFLAWRSLVRFQMTDTENSFETAI